MTLPRNRALLSAFMGASLLSGCAALLNQVMWTRILSLVFGSTIEAVSAVTAIFMAGLALGSGLTPRLLASRTPAEASALYWRIEAALGIVSVVLAFLLPSFEALRASAGVAPVWALTIALLLAPTTLMGATLVTQSHAIAAFSTEVVAARAGGLLFGANTLGAVVGAYGSVLLLVPTLGVRRTIFTAAALHILAAVIGKLAARSASLVTSEQEGAAAPASPYGGSRREKKARDRGKTVLMTEPSAKTAVDSEGNRGAGVALIALFVAGFSGLANEVAWTRSFILVAGPTAHAFAFVLGAIVLGLAAGALISSGILAPLKKANAAFGLVQIGVAVASGFVLRAFASMPLLYGESVRQLVDRPHDLVDLQASASLKLLFPAAALSGALFPLGLRILRARFSTAQAMGYASALNTAGAIAGAILAGFVLLPALGLDRTLRLTAILSAVSGAVVIFQGRSLHKLLGGLAGAGAIVFVLQGPAFDKDLFAGGAYKYSAYDLNLSVEEVLRRGELVSYEEGRIANVSVKRVGSSFSLAVDGKVDATSGGDMLTQRLLAHVPFLINEKPDSALVIGLGSGVTAAAAIAHAPASVTAVEISPEVAGAARKFFAVANKGVLDDPKLKLIIGDARQIVLSSKDKFDVVISEPSNPWMVGVSALFTSEFFRAVKARLKEGGVFCQWGHLYNMGEPDLATLLATFADVFPEGRVYLISEADILIVGSDHSPVLSEGRLAGVSELVRRDLAASKLTINMLRAIPHVPLLGLAWLRDARRHTDDRPVLDFSAPLFIHAQTAASNRRRFLPGESPEGPSLLNARLALLRASLSAEWAFELSESAVLAGTADPGIVRDYVKNALRLHRAPQAEATLGRAIERAPAPALLVGRALLYWNTARPQPALEALEQASRLDPKIVEAYLLAAEIQSGAGDLGAVRKLAARVFTVEKGNAEAMGLLAEADFKEGHFASAIERADEALNTDGAEFRALEIRALSLTQLGRASEADQAFQRLVDAAPDVATARINYGVFALQQGDARKAGVLFKDAVDLDPTNPDGYRGLKEAAEALGRADLLRYAETGLTRLGR